MVLNFRRADTDQSRAKMGLKITKEDFDKLPESVKAKFTADGDGYSLQEEDVEGLKRSKAEILAEKKRIQDEADAMKKRLDEIDASKSADEEEKLKAAGAFKELEDKLRAKLTETETKAAEREAGLLSNFKNERLTNELIKRGVLADRAKYALADIADQVDLVSDDSGFSLKVKNGIGDAKEFDTLIESVKTSSPFFFAANGASGSGASGSDGNGGGGIDPSKMTPEQKIASAYETKK